MPLEIKLVCLFVGAFLLFLGIVLHKTRVHAAYLKGRADEREEGKQLRRAARVAVNTFTRKAVKFSHN